MHDCLSRLGRVGRVARREVIVLGLLVSAGVAQADSSGFTGDFAPSAWTNSPPGLGAAYFTNSDNELVLTGPNLPSQPIAESLDPIAYNGPLQGGLVVGGTVEFHWEYNSGDTDSGSGASFAWTLGGGGTIQTNLAAGGPGVIDSGDFSTPVLKPGTTFSFLLISSDTPANKLSGTLIVTNFQFHADVPEPSAQVLFASIGVLLGATRWRRARRLRHAALTCPLDASHQTTIRRSPPGIHKHSQY